MIIIEHTFDLNGNQLVWTNLFSFRSSYLFMKWNLDCMDMDTSKCKERERESDEKNRLVIRFFLLHDGIHFMLYLIHLQKHGLRSLMSFKIWIRHIDTESYDRSLDSISILSAKLSSFHNVARARSPSSLNDCFRQLMKTFHSNDK